MIPRRALERLCKDERINQNRSDTVHDVLKDVSAQLFVHLITRIIQYADQQGRDTILRALSHSAAHIELDKLFCSLQDEHVTEVFDILAIIKYERQKAEPFDIRRAQEALFSPRSSPISYGEGYSPTPDPAEMRIAKWVSDQKTLLSEHNQSLGHVNNRKRHHSEVASDEHDSSHVVDALPEIEPRERVGVRRQPNRSCKSKGATQSAMPDGKRDLRTRKIAPPENNQRSTRGTVKPTTRNGNIRVRRIHSNKEPTTLNNGM
ncbi:MAG: hypothetical protein L6R35_005737 [Caloplaca aegaea]|nr:MAG: hypothetical protein L6R35_005737 [Caloplaca aegaea]